MNNCGRILDLLDNGLYPRCQSYVFSALLDMPKGAVFTATALAAVVSTLVMAFYAKKPFARADELWRFTRETRAVK